VKISNHGVVSGAGYAALAALCWGAATVMSKSALAEFAPLDLLVVQLAASVACLWVVVWWFRLPRAAPGEMLRVAWLGLLEPALAYMLGLIGLAQVGAAQATVIQSVEGILIVLVSALLFRQRPSTRFLVLSLLALAGLVFAIDPMAAMPGQSTHLGGGLLILLATLVAAIYVVLSGVIAGSANAFVIVAVQQSVALAFSFVVMVAWPISEAGSLVWPAELMPWAIACCSGVVQYALAFTLYMKALGMIPANTAGAFLTLTPVFGLVGASLFLHETLSATQTMGAAATLFFVWRISREKGATHEPGLPAS
jgi:drug/metabolite transporter (DMT)-like permease